VPDDNADLIGVPLARSDLAEALTSLDDLAELPSDLSEALASLEDLVGSPSNNN